MNISVHDFLDELEELYPEKFLQLLGMDYNENSLKLFIVNKNVVDFDLAEFKRFMDISTFDKHVPYSHKINQAPIIGEIHLDSKTGEMKIFDGSVWISPTI